MMVWCVVRVWRLYGYDWVWVRDQPPLLFDGRALGTLVAKWWAYLQRHEGATAENARLELLVHREGRWQSHTLYPGPFPAGTRRWTR